MIRRFGQPPDPSRRYVRRAGAYALLPLNGMLLLTAQVDSEGVDLQLPGGGIDPGESPVNALHREVFEETGFHISSPRRIGVFRRFVYMPEYDLWAEKICQIYTARPVLRLGPPTEEGHEALWVDPNHAASALRNPGDQHFARRFASGLIPF